MPRSNLEPQLSVDTKKTDSPKENKGKRILPPPINIPTRLHKSHVADDFELALTQTNLKNLDYYEETRKKPIKILMTREISQYYGRETFIKTTIKEIFIYGLFIVVLSILVLATPASDMHMFTTSMADIFIHEKFITGYNRITFKEITTIEHIWQFFDHTVYEFDEDKFFPPPDSKSKIPLENQLIGLPRIRILRVRNDSCTIVDAFKEQLNKCYGRYSSSNEDTSPFGKMTGTAWNYTSPNILDMRTVYGSVGSYSGGGFYVDCPKNPGKFRNILYQLARRLWIDRGTRAITYDFVVYNANVNLFGIIKFLFEKPTTGGIVSSLIIHSMKIIDLGTSTYSTVICSILFIVFFVFYTVEELYEMTYFKWKFICSFWNFLDVGIVLMCYLVITTIMFQYVMINVLLDGLEENDKRFPDFDVMLYVQIISNISFSLLIFFTWLKVLKYVTVSHSMYQLQATLHLAVQDMCWYCFIFVWVFFSFAFVGHCLFKTEIEIYKTVYASLWTLLRAGVGDFPYNPLVDKRPILGHLFFFLTVFLFSCIFVVMFLAILLDRYSEIRSEVYSSPAQMKMSDVLENYLVDIIATFSKKKAALAREGFNKKKLRNKFQDVRYLLMRCGFTELEVNLFLAKYEISEDRVMTDEDLENVMSQFKSKGPPGVDLARELVRKNASEKLSAMEEAIKTADKKTAIVLKMLDLFEAKLTT